VRRKSAIILAGSDDPGELMKALELLGKRVVPHIRDV
jgi:hypothetical protein